jgi:hypothetical protein
MAHKISMPLESFPTASNRALACDFTLAAISWRPTCTMRIPAA